MLLAQNQLQLYQYMHPLVGVSSGERVSLKGGDASVSMHYVFMVECDKQPPCDRAELLARPLSFPPVTGCEGM